MQSKEGEGGYELVQFLKTEFDEHAPDLSPDGRFVAYVSDEGGEFEVYVQRFPEGGRRWQVSTQGGLQPRWRGDGKELFYVEGDTLMAVAVTTAPTFTVGTAKRLFEGKGAFDGRGQHYDVAADGRRFVLAEPAGANAPEPSIRVVMNWYEEFRDREQD